jgi:hypothetical protein
MRKRYRVLLLAALVAALIVPVGFALSLESATCAVGAHSAVAGRGSALVTTAVFALSTSALALIGPIPVGRSLPEYAALFLLGALLFGLAAIVRKAL